jgi:hypothetical protein
LEGYKAKKGIRVRRVRIGGYKGKTGIRVAKGKKDIRVRRVRQTRSRCASDKRCSGASATNTVQVRLRQTLSWCVYNEAFKVRRRQTS